MLFPICAGRPRKTKEENIVDAPPPTTAPPLVLMAAAIRSLLRKAAPSLGRGSPALGRMSPVVQGLSPAARLLSTTGGQVAYSDDDKTLAKQREEIKRMTAEFDASMLEIRKNLDAMDEIERRSAEDYEKFRKKLNNIEKACNVALIVLVPSTVLLFMSL